MTQPKDNNVGELIAYLRCSKNISQRTLAEHLNLSTSSICRWENKTASPSSAYYRDLAEYFDIPIDALYHPEETLQKLKGELVAPAHPAPKSLPKCKKKTIYMVSLSLMTLMALLVIAHLPGDSYKILSTTATASADGMTLQISVLTGRPADSSESYQLSREIVADYRDEADALHTDTITVLFFSEVPSSPEEDPFYLYIEDLHVPLPPHS